MYTIDRKSLGKWQLEKLNGLRNVEVRVNSKVTKIEKDFVVVNGNKIFYKFLVGADGSSSIVRGYLGIGFKGIGIAFQ